MATINLKAYTPSIERKMCCTCGAVLPVSGFLKCKRSADGYVGQCKRCTNARKLREKRDREIRQQYEKLKYEKESE